MTQEHKHTPPKRYRGERTPHGVIVTVRDPGYLEGEYFLSPRYDLRNHSPDGFEYGYAGSGPAQLALALCADATGDDRQAERVYQDVKFKLVARLSGDAWELTREQVLNAVRSAERGRVIA